ncbi:MAG: glycosyltransferase family 9 protein [Cryomorphaceae bacterium]|jgi:heptosyltransferase-2|nr:glycosyltransferase family 9 protein [Cryomorphaceae bacterium]
MNLDRILVIQTAFLGDVILATPVWENLHAAYPRAQIDVVVKKGNESLLTEHPFLHQVFVFDKQQKFKNLLVLGKTLREQHYDLVINLQRFASSGILMMLARGKESRGFQKNPLSFFFSKRYPHEKKPNWHEVDRNLCLISDLVPAPIRRPQLFPSKEDLNSVQIYQDVPYYCLAPTSVWFTKQAPLEIWLKLIDKLAATNAQIYLLGAPSDRAYLDEIVKNTRSTQVVNLAGQLSLLQSAALMAGAKHNYVNDSGPLHLASATNAPVSAFFCSTVPEFGFGPLSDQSGIIEVKDLDCRPCGLHGHKSCPKGHFRCGAALEIN